jgi:hypothetical protein
MAEAKKVKIEYNGQAVMIDEKLNAAIEQLALDKADGNRANAAFKAMELKIALIDSHLGNKANQAALNELKDGLQGMGITPVTGGKDGISATYKENSPAPAATIQPQIQPLSIAPAAAESATQPATEWEAVNPSINTPAALNAATPDFTADINAPVGVALRNKKRRLCYLP